LHATVDFSVGRSGAFTEAVPAAALLASRGLTYLVAPSYVYGHGFPGAAFHLQPQPAALVKIKENTGITLA